MTSWGFSVLYLTYFLSFMCGSNRWSNIPPPDTFTFFRTNREIPGVGHSTMWRSRGCAFYDVKPRGQVTTDCEARPLPGGGMVDHWFEPHINVIYNGPLSNQCYVILCKLINFNEIPYGYFLRISYKYRIMMFLLGLLIWKRASKVKADKVVKIRSNSNLVL